MSAFWIAATLMTVITLGALIYPLIRKREIDSATRRDFDITVYKDQLKEVDRDLERGLLSPDQAAQARTEIERRMLSAMEQSNEISANALTNSDKSTAKGANGTAVILMFALLVVVPLGAFGVYLTFGQPSMPDQPLASRAKQLNEATQGRSQIAEMISKLERQMQETPDDPNGWALLGKSYRAMGRFSDALGALKKLAELTNNDPEALVMLAETMVEMDQGSVSLKAVELLQAVKKQDPSDPRPYFYIGLERQQKDDLQGAVNEWAALLNHSPSNAPWVGEMQNRIAQLVAQGGIENPKIVLLAPIPEAAPESTQQSNAPEIAPETAPGPTTQQMIDAQKMDGADQQEMIRSMVERLAARLQENPDDLEGWVRLERAYQVLGEAEKALGAQKEIERLKAR
ncbi:MAG: c-type cytochrome biogenesis protein CcmI [Rhodospirillaceae bacterium]|nr:c-type cytochrome biogenesis protein CcmI [Rhodospirillaceae bacterium]